MGKLVQRLSNGFLKVMFFYHYLMWLESVVMVICLIVGALGSLLNDAFGELFALGVCVLVLYIIMGMIWRPLWHIVNKIDKAKADKYLDLSVIGPYILRK